MEELGYFMERILNEIAAGEGLIVWKDDAVVLRVSLVTSLDRPLVGLLLFWSEAPNIVRKHVKVRSVVNNPAG